MFVKPKPAILGEHSWDWCRRSLINSIHSLKYAYIYGRILQNVNSNATFANLVQTSNFNFPIGQWAWVCWYGECLSVHCPSIHSAFSWYERQKIYHSLIKAGLLAALEMNFLAVHRAIVDLPPNYILLQIYVIYHIFANCCIRPLWYWSCYSNIFFCKSPFFYRRFRHCFLQLVFTSCHTSSHENFQTVALFLFVITLTNF